MTLLWKQEAASKESKCKQEKAAIGKAITLEEVEKCQLHREVGKLSICVK